MAREVVLGFLWLASLIAEVASLAFVAKGARINDMKNGWNPALLEKLWTLSEVIHLFSLHQLGSTNSINI